jgi:hypothetical protein
MSVKLYFPEGEIDFIASAPVTDDPPSTERILGREVRVETTAEIIGKKIRYRGSAFTGRDLFDLALVATRDLRAIGTIRPILRWQGPALRERIATGGKALRTAAARPQAQGVRLSSDLVRAAPGARRTTTA